MKLKLLAILLGLIMASESLAYVPKTPYLRLRSKRPLHVWYKRDLTFLDLRTQLVQTLKEIRLHLARAEAEGLNSSQKSALKGLEKALEKEMLKAQRSLKRLSRELEAEIKKENPSLARYREIVQEIQKIWEDLLLKNFEVRQKLKNFLKRKQKSPVGVTNRASNF